jgi:hypothetical protein
MAFIITETGGKILLGGGGFLLTTAEAEQPGPRRGGAVWQKGRSYAQEEEPEEPEESIGAQVIQDLRDSKQPKPTAPADTEAAQFAQASVQQIIETAESFRPEIATLAPKKRNSRKKNKTDTAVSFEEQYMSLALLLAQCDD